MDPNMMPSKMSRDEYEMQLYGLTQKTVVSSVVETFKETLELVLNNMSEKLAKKYNQELLNDFKTALLNAYNNSIQKHSADLEKIVEEYFSIDPAFLLPEDEIQLDDHDEVYEANLDRQYENAKRQLIGLSVMEGKLKLLVEKISGDDGIVGELAMKGLTANLAADFSDLAGTIDQSVPALTSLLLSKLSLSEPENCSISEQ